MSTRQTLRDFLTSVGSTQASISTPVEPGPDGFVNEGDDLGVEPGLRKSLLDYSTSQSLLNDYTSFITRDNEYPLSPGAHVAPSPRRGNSLSNAESQSAVDVFTPNSGESATALNRSTSGQFDAAGLPIGSIVDKIGDARPGGGEDGNSLLPNVVSAASNADSVENQARVVQGAFAVLKKYNNISPTSRQTSYSNDEYGNERSAGQFNSTLTTRVQVGQGSYEPQDNIVSATLTQDEMTKIARSMILKSAGWDTSEIPYEAIDPDGALDAVGIDSLEKFPSVVKRDARPDAFRPRDAYGVPTGPAGESFLDGRGDAVQRTAEGAEYSKSVGSTDTPTSQFASNPAQRDARIQALQAGIAIVGLGHLIDKSLVNVNSYIKELEVSKDQVLRGPYFMGSSIKSNVTVKVRALVRSFMFQTGIYSYASCVAEGLYSTFGFSTLNSIDLPIEFDTPYLARRYKKEIENIANNLGTNFIESPMGLSHGFWKSVAGSAVKIITQLQQAAQTANAADYAACILAMPESLAVRIMNVFAQIGYQRLIIQGIPTEQVKNGEQPRNPWDIDGYPNAPGTRQMKSRDGELLSKTSLAWRNSSLPSMFLLPLEMIRATIDMDFMFDKERGSNPVKGMLGSTLYDKTYVNGARNQGIIPAGVARRLEDRLGAEYLPFYFRDMRTNEIIAFHGFLDNITDSFTPSNTTTQGFGRSDGVKNYSNTKRSVGGSFWIVATSKEDFDEMWFKINKLTTLAYPQYTKGREVVASDNTLLGSLLNRKIKFEQPFSQLVGGTPIIRMRIGDLIKTNYSRFNLSRIFGIGNDTFETEYVKTDISDAKKDEEKKATKEKWINASLIPFLAYAASPMELTKLASLAAGSSGEGAAAAGAEALAGVAALFLKNGFVNPFLYIDRTKFFKRGAESQLGLADNPVRDFLGATNVLLKSRSNTYTAKFPSGLSERLLVQRPVLVKIGNQLTRESGIAYEVKIVDNTVSDQLKTATLVVSAADLYVDTASFVDITSVPGVLLGIASLSSIVGTVTTAAEGLANAAAGVPLEASFADAIGSTARSFTSPIYNPITRAFEERMGEGLAGVFTSLSFTWMEAPWESDWNSRAPMACKVTFGFDPIHDISPGLDASGFNRAPIYNVGQIMHDSFGNSRIDGGAAARYFYKRGGAFAESAKNPEKATGAGD